MGIALRLSIDPHAGEVRAGHSELDSTFPERSVRVTVGEATSGSAGATASVAEVYKQLATNLDITLLEHSRSHVWRTTLSKRYEEAGVPREHYAAVLGHDEETNARSYTDRTVTLALVEAYRDRHRG